MSEKKTFKLNGAIVKLNVMETAMAERAIDVALRAIKSNNTEKVRHRLRRVSGAPAHVTFCWRVCNTLAVGVTRVRGDQMFVVA